jgi:hypothetical protein
MTNLKAYKIFQACPGSLHRVFEYSNAVRKADPEGGSKNHTARQQKKGMEISQTLF